MRKSDIVIAVITHRSGIVPPAKRILTDLSAALKHFSLTLESWNHEVDHRLTHYIIKHIGSVKGQLSMQALIADIDILVRRGSADPRARAQFSN